MSASAASLICADEPVPRWSSTGDAAPRPIGSPALLRALHSTQRPNVIGARAKPIGTSSGSNHSNAAPSRLTPTPTAVIKPP
jgi:hypothetical protein